MTKFIGICKCVDLRPNGTISNKMILDRYSPHVSVD